MAGLKFAIRIDDCPTYPDPVESENMAEVAEKHGAVLTLAICSGFLKEWEAHQSIYKRLFDESLLDIACHGWKHEDFGGIGMVGEYGGEPHYFTPLNTMSEIGKVLKECQDFAESFFGRKYGLFVSCGSNLASVFVPRDISSFYGILHLTGFKAISNYPVGGSEPIIRVCQRTEHIWEVPYTIIVDFYSRSFLKNLYTPQDYERYLEAVKEHIAFRFRHGMYVCLYLHMINFREEPSPEHGFHGGNPGGKFLDEVLTWTKERYPDVEFVGMEDLIPTSRKP